MKKILISGAFLIMLVEFVTAQPPSIGGYNVYYGDLHNHSIVSDGTGTPAMAYNYAKNTAHLDFFCLTDHNGAISSSEWIDIKNQANAYNQNGAFTAFYGFEWSSGDESYGDVGVLNTDDYCGTSSPTGTFAELINWLAYRPNGIAFFNHPGKYNSLGHEFSHFTTAPSDQLVGMELFNRDDIYDIYYYNDGYYTGDNNKSFFDEALERGWRVGATGGGDNHQGAWGVATPYRMAILSDNLTRADLLEAMQERRFFSTLDRNLSLSFKINGMEMGSSMSGGNYSARIQAGDANGEIFNQVVLYDKNHNVVNTWSLNTSNVNVSINLNTSDGDYYYVKVKQADGDEAISSPIWISGGASNQYPVCSITGPSDGETFTSPSDITIDAEASDGDGSISKVEFYEGTTKLGEDFSSPYRLRWNGVTTGSYSLTVRATDNSGAVATSSAVSITITGRPITVEAYPQTKVYGESDPELTYQITSGSLMGSDEFSGTLTRDDGENVGTYTIRQGTLTLNSNYTITFSEADLFITERPIAIAADPKTKEYGDPDPALTWRITSGTLIEADEFIGTLTRNDGENVGTYLILLGSLALNSNYSVSYSGANLTITERPITVTADPGIKIYGDTDPSLTWRITSGTLAGSDEFSGTLIRDDGENVGTYEILQGTLTLNSNYAVSYSGAYLTIAVRPVTVAADPKTKVYGDPDPALSWKITSGTLIGMDNFSGTNTRDGGENVGSYKIRQGTLALNSNYVVRYSEADLMIAARPVTIAADPKIKVYGDPDPALTWRITSGTLVGTDAISGRLTRTIGENIGTYTIWQGTLTLNNNYSVSFSGADVTITARPVTVTADPKTKVYGDTDPTLTWRITSGTLVGTDAISGTLTRNVGENIGTYTIRQGTLKLNSNYAVTYSGADLTIAARPLTVTADPKNKVYGDPDPALTWRITSGTLIGTDTVSGTLTRDGGENVGSYSIRQGTLTLNSNYSITCSDSDLKITSRPVSITAEPKTKVYGDSDPELTWRITSGTLVGIDKFSGTITRDGGENVGSYTIRQGTLALNSNYNVRYSEADLTITARPVTVASDPKTKVYGDPDPELTWQITSGTLAGADKFSGTLTRDGGENIGTYTIRQGTLTLNSNYSITCSEAELKIVPRPVTITAIPKTKVYGEPDPALTWRITSGSLAGTDKISGTLTRDGGENVGIYTIRRGTLALNSNYAVDYSEADLTINARSVTVTANPRKKVYGESDPALTWRITYGTLVGTDAISGALVRDEGEDVGTYAINQGDLNLGSNYILAFIGADFRITASFEMKAFPNPFEDHISFELELNYDAEICIDIFNLRGIKIATVFSGYVKADFYHFDYMPGYLSSGLIIYQLTINGQVASKGKAIHYE